MSATSDGPETTPPKKPVPSWLFPMGVMVFSVTLAVATGRRELGLGIALGFSLRSFWTDWFGNAQ